MEKKFWKRGLVLTLILGMTIGLCACGKKNKMENSALAKENVYRLQEITLPKFYESGNGNMVVLGKAHQDGIVQLLVQIYNWQDYDSNQNDIRLLTMKEDGSDLQVIPLEIPTPVNNAESEEVTEEPTEEPVETPVEDTVDDAIAVEPRNSYSYENYNNFILTSEGTIYGVHNKGYEDWSNPEQYIRETTYSLVSWTKDGKLSGEEVALDFMNTDENGDDSWIQSVLQAKDGGLLFIYQNSEGEFWKAKVNGTTVSNPSKLPDEIKDMFYNYDSMIPQQDGTLVLIHRDVEDYAKIYTSCLDVESGTITEKNSIPQSVLNLWGYGAMYKGIQSDLIFAGSNGVYTYNFGDETATMKMDTVNSDLMVNEWSVLVELSDTSFLAFYRESWEEGLKAGVFNYVKPEDIKDKATLVLAGQWIDYDIKKRVIDYNKNNQDARIVLRDYSQYNTEENQYTGALTQLNNDIISGKMPDILIDNGNIAVESYVKKGLLADVGKLIEKDEELSKTEFMNNVFEAYKVNENLYHVIPSFQVITMTAKKSLVGNRTTWTMDDMYQVLATMGEGASPIGEVTQSTFMNYVMQFNGNEYVELSSGKCSFNSDGFIKMLEYAKTLPKEIDYNGDGDWDYENWASQYRDNRTLLMYTYLSSFDYMTRGFKEYFGDDFTLVGFPSETGKGAYLQMNSGYVLSAKSANLDYAWDFTRYYLTEEYQKTNYGFPTRRDLFMEQSKKPMDRPYWEDENGEKQYYDDTIYINGEEVILEPMTQEQVNEVIAYIESVDNRYFYIQEIMDIINEEAEGFFTGQKSATEVADIIQRRAQIYVDENQ